MGMSMHTGCLSIFCGTVALAADALNHVGCRAGSPWPFFAPHSDQDLGNLEARSSPWDLL